MVGIKELNACEAVTCFPSRMICSTAPCPARLCYCITCNIHQHAPPASLCLRITCSIHGLALPTNLCPNTICNIHQHAPSFRFHQKKTRNVELLSFRGGAMEQRKAAMSKQESQGNHPPADLLILF